MAKSKRVLALLLSAVMGCSMLMPASAAEENCRPVSDATLAQWSQSLSPNVQEQAFMMQYLETKSGWKKGYDIIAQSPWLYNPSTKMVFSYEDTRSLQVRADYIKNNGLAGCIVWDAQGDRIGTFPLFNQLKTTLKNNGKQVIAYFGNWMAWGEEGSSHTQGQDATLLPWDQVTCINYAFFGVSTGAKDSSAETGNPRNSIAIPKYKLVTLDENLDFGSSTLSVAKKYGADVTEAARDEWALDQVGKVQQEKAKHPGVNLVLSVGGWTRSQMFHEMASTAANRKVFIDSCVEFLRDFPGFDGIDIDWEYPGVARGSEGGDDKGNPAGPEDVQNFVSLIKELRAALDSNFSTHKILTACAPAAPEKLAYWDAQKVYNDLDTINIMTYDFFGNWDGKMQGYNSPMFNPDSSTAWCTDNSVKWFLDKGVPASKLNIGSPFYAFGYSNVSADANGNPSCLPNPMVKSMSGSSMSLNVNETKPIDATYTFTDNSTRKISSLYNDLTATVTSGSDVASVAKDSKTGVWSVKGLKNGTATINVSAPKDNLSATVTVTVSGSGTIDPPPASNVTITMKLATPYIVKNGVRVNSVVNPQGCLPQPLLVSNGTVLPMRFVCEQLGFQVEYDDVTGYSSVVNPTTGDKIMLITGTPYMYKYDKNGNFVTTLQSRAPIILISNTTHVPVRELLEGFGYKVGWYESNGSGYIIISTDSQESNYASLVSAFERA